LATALSATRLEWVTWRPISVIDDASSSVAAGQPVHDGGDRGERPRQAAAEQEREQYGGGQDRDHAEDQIALRARRSGGIVAGVLDDLEHGDGLAGIVLDLAEIELHRMAVENGVAQHGRAVHHALELVRGRDHAVAEGGRQPLEVLAVERMHGEVDAEALLGAVDEFLAEGDADIDIAQRLAVTHDRGHAEDRKRLAGGLDADDRSAGLDRFHHGDAPCGGVVAEDFRGVDPVEARRRGLPERDQRDALRLDRRPGGAEQLAEPIAVALGDRLFDRRQGSDDGGDRKRGAAFIVDGGDHAVILQLELLIEREPGQRTLLADREAAEDGAGDRDGQ
jgi:hypothetical protein